MKRIILLILIVFVYNNSNSQNLSFDLDFASFDYKGNEVIWELYYSFPDTILSYSLIDGKYIGELKIDVLMKNNMETVIEDSWFATSVLEEKPESHKTFIYGTRSYAVPSGEYVCKISIEDKNDTSKNANIELKVVIKDFDKNNIAVSDMQLAKVIENKDTASMQWDKMFYKNNYYVIPNPAHIIDREPYELKLYYEIYNAQKFAPHGININYKLIDGANREIFSVPAQRIPNSDAMVQSLVLPISALPTGTYFIKVEISYGNEDEVISSLKRIEKFFLINKNLPPKLKTRFTESNKFEKSEFATMDADDIETEFKKIKIIATNNEIRPYYKLETLRAKQRFIFRFWKNKDLDTNDFVNERRREFLRAVDYSNTYFSYGMNKEGWSTDRGRALLKYGFPTDREINVAEPGLNAYEVWFFQGVQGGIKIYFVDKQGHNNFIKVHSTAFGDIYDPNWFDNHVMRFNMKNDPNAQEQYQEQKNESY